MRPFQIIFNPTSAAELAQMPKELQLQILGEFRGLHHLLRQDTKFTEDLQLQFLWHLRQLSGTGGIEDDLERPHELVEGRKSRVESREQNSRVESRKSRVESGRRHGRESSG